MADPFPLSPTLAPIRFPASTLAAGRASRSMTSDKALAAGMIGSRKSAIALACLFVISCCFRCLSDSSHLNSPCLQLYQTWLSHLDDLSHVVRKHTLVRYS